LSHWLFDTTIDIGVTFLRRNISLCRFWGAPRFYLKKL